MPDLGRDPRGTSGVARPQNDALPRARETYGETSALLARPAQDTDQQVVDLGEGSRVERADVVVTALQAMRGIAFLSVLPAYEIERLYRDVPKIDWQAERPDVPIE